MAVVEPTLDEEGRVYFPMMTLEGNALKGFEHLARELRQFPKQYNAALVTTLNKSMVNARADAVRLIKKRYTLKPKYIMRGFFIRKAYARNPSAQLRVAAKRGIHMADWNAVQVKGGVRVQIYRGGRPTFLKNTVIGKGECSGKKIVFQYYTDIRPGARSGVHAVYTTTGYEFLGHSRIKKYLLSHAEKKLLKNGVRNMEYYLAKAKGAK